MLPCAAGVTGDMQVALGLAVVREEVVDGEGLRQREGTGDVLGADVGG